MHQLLGVGDEICVRPGITVRLDPAGIQIDSRTPRRHSPQSGKQAASVQRVLEKNPRRERVQIYSRRNQASLHQWPCFRSEHNAGSVLTHEQWPKSEAIRFQFEHPARTVGEQQVELAKPGTGQPRTAGTVLPKRVEEGIRDPCELRVQRPADRNCVNPRQFLVRLGELVGRPAHEQKFKPGDADYFRLHAVDGESVAHGCEFSGCDFARHTE